jgi:O-methyltransferase involved in polyketide biosynthesis
MATYWQDHYLEKNNANVAVFADYLAEEASSQRGFERGINTDAVKQGERIAPSLDGVSETMLWSLHNRACEARRHDTVLADPHSISIHDAIDYDFTRRFGAAAGSLAVRAAEIDSVLRKWLERHPDGLVVSLGEGLETQVKRVDNGRLRWLSVDLPDAIRLRESFIAPTERFRHISVSALDVAWMDEVASSSEIFIVAQGLLMYLKPEEVGHLLFSIADRFPGAEMVFDVVPRWFSRLTILGLNQTPHYRLPIMPWGINRDEVKQTLLQWHPRLRDVEFLNYRFLRGPSAFFTNMIRGLPAFQNEAPSLIHVTVAALVCPSTVTSKFNNPRKNIIRSVNDGLNETKTFDCMVAEATRSIGRNNDLANTAGKIVKKRVALGMKTALNPQRADHDEFARMVPEKVEAFSAAGVIMLQQSNHANQQIMRMASDEVSATGRAVIGLAGCRSPEALFEAQAKFARAALNRAASNFITISMLALNSHDAILAPIRQTVAVNTERLG